MLDSLNDTHLSREPWSVLGKWSFVSIVKILCFGILLVLVILSVIFGLRYGISQLLVRISNFL